MPELPEMQALAERLDAAFGGRPVLALTPLSFAALKTVRPAPEDMAGRLIGNVGRRGKYLLFDLGDDRLAVHLSQGGRIDLEDPPKSTRPKGAVMRLTVDGGPAMLVKEFGTERKAAWWLLAAGDEGPLTGLGPEPDSALFAELVHTGTDRRQVHTLLRDQRTVAGIGRGYADDILHRAGLSPFGSLGALETRQRADLLAAVGEVLGAALEEERKRRGGLPAKLGQRFTVHGRYGTPCPRCAGDLRRVSFESHEITYCPACQTGGRVLADRRLSRLVR